MAKIFTIPPYVAIDGNGVPMAGALLYFYITGTTTPKDTYSDSALTIPNTNPVVADGNGLFGPIYLAQDVDYKLVLENSAGTTIATRDPLLVINSSVIAHQGSLIVGDSSGADSELLIDPTNGARLTSNGTTAIWRNPAYTSTVIKSGSGNYIVPTNCTGIRIRMVAAGGGGGGTGVSTAPTGATGDNTTFNGIVANGGVGGLGSTSIGAVAGGAGGSGGSGTTNVTLRVSGSQGGFALGISGGFEMAGGGGSSPLFFGGAPTAVNTSGTGAVGIAGTSNTGGGGGGAQGGDAVAQAGAGGGGGEGVEMVIPIPAASYTYVVGTGGAGGIGTGTGAETGGAGGSGVIVIDEYYS